MLSFDTLQGGTSRLECYTKTNENEPSEMQFYRQLPLAARTKVARADKIAGALDTRPLSLCDGHAVMRELAKIVFEMGQTIPEHEKIDPKSYLPEELQWFLLFKNM